MQECKRFTPSLKQSACDLGTFGNDTVRPRQSGLMHSLPHALPHALPFEAQLPIDDLLIDAFRNMFHSDAVRGRPGSMLELAASLESGMRAFSLDGLLLVLSSTCRRLRDDTSLWLHGTPLRTPLSAAVTSVRVLEWALGAGCPRDAALCSAAAAAGRLDVLEHARNELGIPWDAATTTAAAIGGHDAVLTFALDCGCEMEPRACAIAAAAGSLRGVQLLRAAHSTSSEERGDLIWDSEVCRAAAGCGAHAVDILQWCHAEGCPPCLGGRCEQPCQSAHRPTQRKRGGQQRNKRPAAYSTGRSRRTS